VCNSESVLPSSHHGCPLPCEAGEGEGGGSLLASVPPSILHSNWARLSLSTASS